MQVDVVAINRSEQIALLGEARWTSRPLGTEVLHELQAKSKGIPALEGWHIHYALFSRSGFTEALQQEAKRQHILLFEFTDMLLCSGLTQDEDVGFDKLSPRPRLA